MAQLSLLGQVEIPHYNDPDIESQKVQKIQGVFDILDQRWTKFRQEALRNYEYLVGNQIDEETKKELQHDRRPELVFNLLMPLILYIAGMIATNKTRMRAIPVRMGDEDLADLHTVLVSDWAMELCDGYYEIAKAAIDAAIAKIGWTNNFWDFKNSPEGSWLTKAWDPMMIMFDADARAQENQEDWRYMTVSGFYSVEDIIRYYRPDPETAALLRQRARDLEGESPNQKGPRSYLDRVWNGFVQDYLGNGPKAGHNQIIVDNYSDTRNGLYRVIDFHDRRYETMKTIYNVLTRQTRQSPADKQGELTDPNEISLFEDQVESFWITAVCPRLLPEKPLLEKPYPVQGKGFQFKPIFCYAFHPDVTKTTSVIDNLISPQDCVNQQAMTELELIMQAVNFSYVALKNSIAPEDLPAWLNGERGVMKFYRTATDKPQAEEPQSEAIIALANFGEKALELFPRLSAISPNQAGFKETKGEGAALYNQRVQAGLTTLNHYFSHIQRSMEQIFGCCDKNIQTFMKKERAVRLLGEPPDGMQGVQMSKEEADYYWLQVNEQTLDGVLNDVSQGEYDFRPDMTQLGQTAKQLKHIEMMNMFKIIPPELLDFAMLAEAWDSPYGKKMAAYIRKKMGEMDQQRAQEQAAAKAKTQMEIADQAMQGADVQQLAESRREG